MPRRRVPMWVVRPDWVDGDQGHVFTAFLYAAGVVEIAVEGEGCVGCCPLGAWNESLELVLAGGCQWGSRRPSTRPNLLELCTEERETKHYFNIPRNKACRLDKVSLSALVF